MTVRFRFHPLRCGGLAAGAVLVVALFVALLAALLLASAAAAGPRSAGAGAALRLVGQRRSAPRFVGPPSGGAHAGGSQPSWRRPAPPQTTYLALGDSLAFGYSQAKFNSLYPTENPAAFDTGYVDDFGKVLRLLHPGLQVVNDGCPGETTESFINGPCAYQEEFPLHHPYSGGPSSSQRSEALAYLDSHPGTVDPITIDIGANDALGLIEGTCKLEPACIAAGAPTLFAHIGGNLARILGELRAAAPHAQIVVLGLYNPFGATIAGADELTAKLNAVMAGVAAAVGAGFADPLPVFNPPGALEAPTICLLTNMCTPLVDIHPTDLGYAVIAGLILHRYVLGLPPFERGPWQGMAIG